MIHIRSLFPDLKFLYFLSHTAVSVRLKKVRSNITHLTNLSTDPFGVFSCEPWLNQSLMSFDVHVFNIHPFSWCYAQFCAFTGGLNLSLDKKFKKRIIEKKRSSLLLQKHSYHLGFIHIRIDVAG